MILPSMALSSLSLLTTSRTSIITTSSIPLHQHLPPTNLSSMPLLHNLTASRASTIFDASSAQTEGITELDSSGFAQPQREHQIRCLFCTTSSLAGRSTRLDSSSAHPQGEHRARCLFRTTSSPASGRGPGSTPLLHNLIASQAGSRLDASRF
ncbi:hypothetical protein HDK77DRAFT_307703 [Phyllosticta capitalensis]